MRVTQHFPLHAVIDAGQLYASMSKYPEVAEIRRELKNNIGKGGTAVDWSSVRVGEAIAVVRLWCAKVAASAPDCR